MASKLLTQFSAISYDQLPQFPLPSTSVLIASLARGEETVNNPVDYDASVKSFNLRRLKNEIPESDKLMASSSSAHPQVLRSRAMARRNTSTIPKKDGEKPNEIQSLEGLLSSVYNTEITITRIRELPVSRKSVKEIFFKRDTGISKVWVFKANPLTTAKELFCYKLINERGIPTPKPLVFVPASPNQRYPFDIAVLGGVVEHAGDSYNELIANLQLRPELIFRTAKGVASIISEYQRELTANKDIFSLSGINISPVTPKYELRNRFLAATKISETDALSLVEACESLYARQNCEPVVSHGDLHTNNIVTLLHFDQRTGQYSTDIDKFGLIDWESLRLDNPFSDYQDFWIHHQREALRNVMPYNYSISTLLEECAVPVDKRDIHIQGALWHLYEMFDPLRSNASEIKQKANYHAAALNNELFELGRSGIKKEPTAIRKELSHLLRSFTNITDFLN